MYISRVEVDLTSPQKLKALTHVGAYHSWVENSFPEEKHRGIRSRKIWRVDKIYGKSYLLIVSENAPAKEMIEKYGVTDSYFLKDYGLFLRSIKKGSKLFFKVPLNPVISKATEIGKRGKIIPCFSEEQQMLYFMERAEKNGFSLKQGEFSIVERNRVTLRKANNIKISFIRAVYEGILTVEDEEKFRDILCNGIGRHKAYGFGMMTVMPVR